jgi:hypothetical protein
MTNTSLIATLELPLILFDLSSHLTRSYDDHSSPAFKGAYEGLWGFLVMFNKHLSAKFLAAYIDDERSETHVHHQSSSLVLFVVCR